MKHQCPHCGEKTFSPLQKALCGGMSSAGKPCPKCGFRAVNGKLALVVNSITLGVALVMIFITYFTHDSKTDLLLFGVLPLVLAYVFNFLFNMFVGKLIPAIKRAS
ncbi:MAG: hypothetical protein PUC41_09550 [Oscillospiraceae bacterium]|nr:hypothetical protein [Oscillospiraceae bacterium]